MFYLLSKLLDVFLSPLTWCVIGLGLGLRWRKPVGPKRRWIAFCSLILLLICSTGVVSSCLWRSLERSATDTATADQHYDAVILLGGVVDEAAMRRSTDNPSFNDNVERLLEAYEWLRTARAGVAVLSGGSPSLTAENPVESRVLALQLERWGIERTRLIEDNALNTHDNAVHAAALAQRYRWRRVLAITSAFHAERAQGCFRASGLNVDWKFVDRRAYDNRRLSGSWIPRAESLRMTEAALREMAGWWVYRLRGWVRR